MGGPNIQQQTIQPEWFDPLGPDKNGKHDPTGGPEYRTDVFNRMSARKGVMQKTTDKLLGWLYGFGGDAGEAHWGPMRTLGDRTIAGDFLNGGPYMDQAVQKMRLASEASAASSEAAARSAAARAGIAFSPAAQEAQNSATAAARSHADQTEANLREAVYSDERKMQPGGANLIRESVDAPTQYLANTTAGVYSPFAKEAQIVQGMSGGGTYMTPEVMAWQKPGGFDYATQLLSSL